MATNPTNPTDNPDLSFSVPIMGDPPAPVTPAFSVPETFKDKDFVKAHLTKENPLESILSHYEQLYHTPVPTNTIPGELATDEELEAFYAKTRPQEISKYDLPEKLEIPDAPEVTAQLNTARAEQLPKVKELMHKNGLTAKQAKALVDGFDSIQKATITNQLAAQKAQDTKMNDEFHQMMATLGPDREAAIRDAKEFMYNKIPKEILPKVQALPNEALVAMIATIHHVTKSRLKEDNFMGTQTTPNPETDMASARAALEKAQCDPAYRNKFDPRYEEASAKVRKYASIVYPVK